MRNRAATSLSKAKVRQSWSKYNLFNLSRLRDPYTQSRSHFQQKWTAKGMARAYHGEQVSETKWERMFSRRIRSVVPMSPLKLAQDDGSAMAAGRGTGISSQLAEKRLAESQSSGRRNVNLKGEGKITPFTQMTFAPLERRLDVAVFRAMFASSARQARQFVIHGAVTVNGKKMRYPGYQLNPGDLFQVDPDRVMFATGAPKDKLERREARVARRKDNKESKESEDKEGAAAEESNKSEAKDEEAPAENEDPRETLKALLAQAKNIMNDSKDVLPAKRKQELRGFTRATRRVLSRSGSSTVLTDNLEAQFAELTLLLKAKRAEKKEDKDSKDKQDKKESKPEKAGESDVATAQEGSAEPTADASETKPGEALSEAFRQAAQNPEEEVDTSELTDEEFDVLKHALVQMRDNPIDHSKPYATPWRPRDYMSAFAMIPRYLEVNHNVCAAVYLRHPVARPGLSEVPTPFGEGVGTAAFTWYLRRR